MDVVDSTVFVMVIPVALGIFAALLAWQIRKRRTAARTEALRRQSLLMGFSFDEGPTRLGSADLSRIDSALSSSVATMHMFRRGRRGQIYNLMSSAGDSGRLDWLFDFSFVKGTGRSQHTVRQTVLGCTCRDRHFPRLTLQSEGLIARLFERADIDFDQDPEFSKRYLIKGDDAAEVRRHFSPYLRTMLMEKREWIVEAAGSCVFICREGRLVDPQDLPSVRDEFSRFLEAFA